MEGTRHVAVAVPLGDADDADLVADRLFGLGATAVLEREAQGGGRELVADLPAHAARELPGARVLGAAEDGSSWVAPTTTVRCGRRIVVRATEGLTAQVPDVADAHPEVRPGDVVVHVEAGQAFGTGSHASTRLCLELAEDLAPVATTVLDVGCGTGVLGVAALLLGAGSVRAVDIDPVALDATMAAARHNAVDDRLEVDSTPVEQLDGRFDLVLANLLAPILEALAPALTRKVAPGGALVVGGVLDEQVDRVVAALAPLQVLDRRDDDGWVALALGAPPPG